MQSFSSLSPKKVGEFSFQVYEKERQIFATFLLALLSRILFVFA